MDVAMPVMPKFLVLYDYGTGGIWGFVFAKDAREIEKNLPELRVIQTTPDWMTPKILSSFENSEFQLNDLSTYPDWVNAIIRERSR